MKKVITLVMIILLSCQCFSQASSNDNIAINYLQKSKNQKTVAWFMLGGGVGLIVLAGVVAEPVKINICLFCENQPPEPKRNDALPNTLAIAGLVSMLGSIPMFVVAHHTRTKASSVGFKQQPVFLPGNNAEISQKSQLAIAYRFSF